MELCWHATHVTDYDNAVRRDGYITCCFELVRQWNVVFHEREFLEAVMTGDVPAATYFLTHGMSPNTRTRHYVVTGPMVASHAYPGMTAMHMGVCNMHILELLCDHGGNIHEVHRGTNQTPFYRAVAFGLQLQSSYLLNHGASFHCQALTQLPIYGRDNRQKSPTTQFRSLWGIFLPANERPTPTECSAIKQALMLVFYNGPHPTQVAERLWQAQKAFLLAVSSGDTRLVRKLLDEKREGVDVNEKWNDADSDENGYTQGQTALHVAASLGSMPLVRLLLEHEADIDAMDDEGDTAFGWAYLSCKPKTARLLLSRLADARIGNVLDRPYGGNLVDDDRPEDWEAVGESLRQDWELGAHPDMRWHRRGNFAHFLVGCMFMPLQAHIPTPLPTDVPLPSEPVATEEQRKFLRRKKVFSILGIVRNIASFM